MGDQPVFVVQKHQARTLHYDFRLEKDGVLKSWAVPKGIPNDIGVRRLAIQVNDHSIEYGDFEGDIPEAEYGAGHIEIWDRGTYHLEKWEANEITVVLKGKRVNGRFTLTAFPKGGENQWLLLKRREN